MISAQIACASNSWLAKSSARRRKRKSPKTCSCSSPDRVGTQLIHPIVESDFSRAPIWLNEGIASLFEAPMMPKAGEIHGVKNWRHPRLIAGINSPDEKGDARLDVLFGMSARNFRNGREKLHYAAARYVCQWLDQRGLLWSFYRAYKKDFDADPTGAKSFESVTGMSPAQANAAWTTWVKAL